MEVAGGPDGPGAQRRGWSRSPSARSRRSATRSSRSTRRRASSLQSELVANEQLPGRRAATRGSPPRWTDPLVAGVRPRRRHGADAGAPARRQSGCGWRPRWTTRSTARRAGDLASRASRGPGPDHGHGRAGSRGRRCGWSSTSAYGWSSQRSLPALRDQVAAGARRGARTPAGTACSPSSARTSTTSGSAPTSRSTATRSCSRRCAFALFHVLQAGARAERRGRSRPRA